MLQAHHFKKLRYLRLVRSGFTGFHVNVFNGGPHQAFQMLLVDVRHVVLDHRSAGIIMNYTRHNFHPLPKHYRAHVGDIVVVHHP
jgi:hypothetical protein